MPPNTTTKIQPCEQGIIKCLKMHYRREMVQKAIECFENNSEFSIDLLDAMWYLRKAWRRVKHDTIRNCFRYGGFEESKGTVEEEQDDKMFSVVKDAVKRGISSADLFKEYVSMDDEVLTSAVTTDKDIVREFQKENINQIKTVDEEDADPGA